MDRKRLQHKENIRRKKEKSNNYDEEAFYEETEENIPRLKKNVGKRLHRKRTLKEELLGI
ncbi:MAG TPA: hypothetical protein PK874_08770 [Desulfobacteraceae bacterium]|nr:hypothetical protein [Desulfobacteraceae bacterium]HPJ68114.1 hypothetical protein [Desulfobacteraceae bacterium]HPQ29149.1 hypothetical protein [Desulfobacteraceae bacterium]